MRKIIPKMMLISAWVKDESELDFLKRHMDKKGVKWEIIKHPNTGKYGLFRTYKAVGVTCMPEPLPDRKVWENKL